MFGTFTALSRLAHRELERNEEHARDSSSQLTHTRIFVVMTWRSCDGAFGPCLGAHCSMTRRIPKQWLTKRSFTPHHLSRPALVVPLRCKCQTSERDPLIKATWRSASCPYRRVIRTKHAIGRFWSPPMTAWSKGSIVPSGLWISSCSGACPWRQDGCLASAPWEGLGRSWFVTTCF